MTEFDFNIIQEENRQIVYNLNDDIKISSFNAYIGKNNQNEKVLIEFEKTPHILVGGASGSGKSCLINCIIKSLINKYSDFYFTIIDLKQVEFMEYKNKPQLATPIITTSSKAFQILDKYIQLMEYRYNLLSNKEYKNIKEWNEKEADKMKRHVIVIDELATLLLENKHIKEQLQKLLQLGRAVGFHLILATQAPNCKTIPTELKININCRIALQVPTMQNSKIIIDEPGAEKLKGNGDAIIKINNIKEAFQVALI